jgi:NAD-dependent dihydropyrimidine dehydrogenase PreA subunit
MSSATPVSCEPRRALDALRRFADDEMCGRCLPCPLATRQSIAILERMIGGNGEEQDLVLLERIAGRLMDAARCPRGEKAAQALGESLQNVEEYEKHIAGVCPSGACRTLTRYRVAAERCTMCGSCQEVCPRDAIEGDPYVPYLGDNRPYVIREAKCDGCGRCVEACPVNAIERVE